MLAFWRLFVLCVGMVMFLLVGVREGRAGLLLLDDFEDPARSKAFWGASNEVITRGFIIDPTKARSGSGVFQMKYEPGWNGPGFVGVDFAPVPEVYLRWYERYSPGWVWSEVATKGIFVLTNIPHPEGENYGVVTGVGFDDPIYSADVNLVGRLGTGFRIPNGEWVCFELRWHAHTGAFQMWINDALRINKSVGTIPAQYGIKTLMLSGYYNDAQGRSCDGTVPCGVPQLQYRWIDDIAASTTRVGCLPETTDKTPPSTPTGLKLIGQ